MSRADGKARHRARPIPTDNPSGQEVETHERLINWARWLEERTPRGRTASLEGAYIPESGNVFEGLHFRIPVDIPDAEMVDAGVLSLEGPQRLAIGLRYWAKVTDWAICRRVGLRPAEYGDFMSLSRRRLGAYLLLARTALIVAANKQKPIHGIETTLATTEGRAFPNETGERCQQQHSGRARFQVVVLSSPEADASSIRGQSAHAAGSSSQAPARTQTSGGGAYASKSSGPNRSAALVRPKGR